MGNGAVWFISSVPLSRRSRVRIAVPQLRLLSLMSEQPCPKRWDGGSSPPGCANFTNPWSGVSFRVCWKRFLPLIPIHLDEFRYHRYILQFRISFAKAQRDRVSSPHDSHLISASNKRRGNHDSPRTMARTRSLQAHTRDYPLVPNI